MAESKDHRAEARAEREAADKAIVDAVAKLIFDSKGKPRPIGGA